MRVVFFLLLTMMSCRRDDAPPKGLVADVKQALAERDRKLTSFHLVADSSQGTERAHHEFFFRSPNKSRGEVTAPEHLTASFDGTTFFKVLHGQKRFERYTMQASPAQAAYFLASTFDPFVPEGFRAPLLPLKGVTARAVTRPDAPNAVELTVDPGGGVVVTWVLRLPAGDFLEKRTTSGTTVGVLKVTAEQCDEKLALCVPTRLEQSLDGVSVGVTQLTKAELNPALAADDFTLRAPEGYESVQHSLVDQ